MRLRILFHLGMVLFLTMLTQIGGVAWLASRFLRHSLIAFVAIYFALLLCCIAAAPLAGRQALHCWNDGPLQMQSWFYCLSGRNFMAPELLTALQDSATETADAFPGTKTLVLDAGFPFLNGFPLLPHLSHDDGEKADLAFYYRDEAGYRPGSTPSPVGYFAFEPGPTDCPSTWPTLRWDMAILQPLWPKYTIDEPRTKYLLERLANDERIGKILLEPHLKQRLQLTSDKIRFQGCRAARHDDHIHLQL